MKRITIILLTLVCIFLIAYIYVNRSATAFPEKSRFFFIRSDSANLPAVLHELGAQGILRRTGMVKILADRFDYARKVKPGRYRISHGMSEWQVFRLLRNGRQEPVNLVINKFRTQEDFARYAGRQLECDSVQILQLMRNRDSMALYGLDSFTAMTLVIPDTYQFFWNTSASYLFKRMNQEREKFWNSERRDKARAMRLTPEEVYTLASIVEEETNKHDEKPRIASVYLNRMHKGMNLGADPTIKYALRDFGLKRILFKHIDASAASPYNTYRHKGLPPGPICTPSVKSIDAVLSAEATDYLFFCARPDFSGYHAFAADDQEHMRNARAYQAFLDSIQVK
jgi:UPF0755 protein